MSKATEVFIALLRNVVKRFPLNREGTLTSSDSRIAMQLNQAFLNAVLHPGSSIERQARTLLNKHLNTTDWHDTSHFYLKGLELWSTEFDDFITSHIDAGRRLNNINLNDPDKFSDEEIQKVLYSILFPEGEALVDRTKRSQEISRLREQRKIKIKSLNPEPIKQPAKEILFTSNILITKPLDTLSTIDSKIARHLEANTSDPQNYWYDHPIPIGIPARQNEALYGLQGLDQMAAQEIAAGQMNAEDKITCVLSVSSTHKSLQKIVKPYLESEFSKVPPIRHLRVYLFTETITNQLIDEILLPLARRYFPDRNRGAIHHVLGVDGEYGRHYSFLKAVAALWQVFVDKNVKATFKIDLDQVFPQDKLIEETGKTAFAHFKTPYWGANGVDAHGNRIDLSMIAGALVNQSDIQNSIFTPDVLFPDQPLEPDEFVFFSRLPQALSTEAEMMLRYSGSSKEISNQVIQRIHVTGGTNGILIKALRKFRPFTPTIFGRAEDQAYLFSVLFEGLPFLRYLHQSGLIMRHDKHAFAQEAIQAASTGKLIGDYIRLLLFSYYARALPWDTSKIKEYTDPFTGCFISELPITVLYLRFALKAHSLMKNQRFKEAEEFIKTGSRRLLKTLTYLSGEDNPMIDVYSKEKETWHLVYDILDHFESDSDIEYRLLVRDQFRQIISKAEISFMRS